jgi:predicted ATP-grasp superfamily ATP-dependent carboligase
LRVFVCEYVTGGGLLREPLPPGLAREGDLMLAALVKDLAVLPGIEIVLSRDARLPLGTHPNWFCIDTENRQAESPLPLRERARVRGSQTPRASRTANTTSDTPSPCPSPTRGEGTRFEGLASTRRGIGFSLLHPTDDAWEAWRDLIRAADAVWPIAPETGGALARLTDLILAENRILLGCRPDAVRLAASKLATVRHLQARGVPVVPTVPLGEVAALATPGPFVVKPDDGAGAAETRLFRDRDGLDRWAARRGADGWIVQPFIDGSADSLSLLCQDGAAWLLSCNAQRVEIRRDAFVYLGGIAGGREARRALYEPIADAVAAAMPGLWGYAGVDLIDRPGGPAVLEVNPRLTTSYVALGRALGANPAGLILRLVADKLAVICHDLAIKPEAVDLEPLDA